MSKRKEWVTRLLDTVMEHWHWQGHCHHLCTNIRPPDARGEPWQVAVAPALQEISEAGPADGQWVWTPFTFELGDFISARGVQQCNMAGFSQGPMTPTPEIILDLLFYNRPVILHILLEPPDDAEPVEVLEPRTGKVRHKCPNHEEAEE